MTDLVIAGLGNIGLPFAEFVARAPGIRRVALVDPDVFTDRNISFQLASGKDVGHPKVDVVAERIAAINPALSVESHHCRLEHTPRATFRDRIIASCLDSRNARAALSEISWAVSAPLWLDAGVRPDGRLARVSVAFPAEGSSAGVCCGWSPRDWALAASEYSCAGTAATRATRAPAFLGATAASLMVHMLERFVAGVMIPQAEAETRTISLDSHRSWTTVVRRNPGCRCTHRAWNIEQLNRAADVCTLSELVNKGSLALPGMPMARNLRCECGSVRRTIYVAGRVSKAFARCECSRQMSIGALDLIDEISLSALEDLGPETPALTLADIGVSKGDIIRLGDRHFEVGVSTTGMPS